MHGFTWKYRRVLLIGLLTIEPFGIQVLLTPSHLAIVMEYAAGGELFERICNAGRFGEDEVSAFGY